mmetsp:Transcript_2406/g.6749  ORF Transcript_2406/g.6749 Transcript_2406/m.6749 type:complete len:290 (+) Transcript_2406:71-940(+)
MLSSMLGMQKSENSEPIIGTSARIKLCVTVCKAQDNSRLGIRLSADDKLGIVVSHLEPELPGAQALQIGDVVAEIDQAHPEDHHAASQMLREARAGALVITLLRQMATVEDAYVMDELLGEGAFGTVHRATSKIDGSHVAVKCIEVDVRDDNEGRANREMLVREVRLLREIKSPHIIQLVDTFESVTDHKLYLVMELCQGGDLSIAVDERKALPEVEVAHVMFQVVSAVAFIHERGIVHRDIKPEVRPRRMQLHSRARLALNDALDSQQYSLPACVLPSKPTCFCPSPR